jgi:hypothetical protein
MITDGTDIDDLYEIKTSDIPGGVPKKDIITKKVVTPKPYKQSRKFRCKNCGRVVIPKKLPENLEQSKIIEMKEKKLRDKFKKEWEEADERARKAYEEKRKEYDEQQ